MEIELRHLRYVVAVADDLSFTRAAQRLHLDQPSLSRQVRRVEQFLGVELFRRTTRSVTVTAAGEEFVRSARRVLDDTERAVEAARRSARSGRPTTLRLGYLVPLRDQLMTRLVRAAEARVPGLHLALVQYDYTVPDAGLGAAEVDLAIVNLPLATVGLRTATLLVEPRVAMLPSDHPLARRSTVQLADLESETTLLWAVPPSGDPVWRAYWSAGDRRGGRLPERRCEPRNPDEYAQLVAAGRAFGLNLPAAAEPFTDYGIALVPVTDLDPVAVCLAWRAADPPPHLHELLDVVEDLRSG